jgi:signal peptidase I
MEPTFFDGDWLLVESLRASRPVGPGDVVVARQGERLVTHRLVSVRDGVVVTKGDACAHPDRPIPLSALLGRVVGLRRAMSPLAFVRRITLRMVRSTRPSNGGEDERI